MEYKILKLRYILISLVFGLLIMGVGCALPGIAGSSVSTVNTLQTPSPAAANYVSTQSSSAVMETGLLLPDFTKLITRARPSVVAITTESTGSFWGREIKQEGAGSGWIVDKDGVIVTNAHVVDGASSVTVTLGDGRTFIAQNISSDANADIAIIKIDARELPVLQIGDSSKLRVGEWVVAIGNSLGLRISATKGIVSALDISLSDSPGVTYARLIQTDAAINPGNSGGPLLNLAGEVIGINSAKIAQVGVEGMGYALSINEAMPIIDKLK